MPWFHNLQWKEKPPEREGARAIRRAKQNKRHLWGLSLLRPAQRTTIALQYNEHGYRLWTGLTLFIRLSIPQKEGLQAFSSSRHSRETPVASHFSAPLHSCLSAIVVTVGFFTILHLHTLSCLVLAMEKFLRSWRQDALNRGQHDAAIYIGDKVLALTSKIQHTKRLITICDLH